MPIIQSAIKRMRQTITRRARNLSTKRSLRDSVKAFNTEKTITNLSKAQADIDKAVKKNLLHKNTAARRKAQLAKQAKEAGVKLVAGKKQAATKSGVQKKSTAKKKAVVKKTTAIKSSTL